jgi:hypothetical protein
MIPPLQKTFGTVLESSQVNAAIRCIWIVFTRPISPSTTTLRVLSGSAAGPLNTAPAFLTDSPNLSVREMRRSRELVFTF